MKDLLNRTIHMGDTVLYLTSKEIKTVASIAADRAFPYLKLTDCSASRVKPTSVIIIDAQLTANKKDYPENFV